MRCVSFLLLAAALGACSTAPQPGRSAQAQAHLQKLLAGKAPGKSVACLPQYRASDLVVIDDNTVAYRDGRTVFVNNFQGGTCFQLGSGFYALVTNSSGGTGLCRGDIARVLDPSSGSIVGSCVFGDFVPYTAPRR